MTIIHPYRLPDLDTEISEAVEELLAGPDAEDIRLNVKRGAAWLEEKGATDWPETIVAAVEAQDFNLARGCKCAVGVCLGEYGNHFGYYGANAHRDSSEVDAEAASLGFFVVDSFSGDDYQGEFIANQARWHATEQVWVDYAYEQKAVR